MSLIALGAWLLSTAPACASLGPLAGLVRAPRFEQVPGQPAELRLTGPTLARPLGGANVRLWTRVTNPNPFGLTLSTLTGTLLLEEARAATADFPLGLPLDAGGASTIPIDLSVDFRDVPGLGDVIRRAAGREPIAYTLEGTIGVDAGRFGTPVFGPMTIVRGTVR
jgi:hypothetical protein